MFKPLALIAPALVALAAPAAAQDTTATVRVAYSDLDLTTDAGRAALDQRLKRAVDRVCDVEPNSLLSRAHAARVCRRVLGADVAAQRNHAIIASRPAQSPVLAAR